MVRCVEAVLLNERLARLCRAIVVQWVLLETSVADAAWWCKRQVDQAKVYTMACDVVIDAVVV